MRTRSYVVGAFDEQNVRRQWNKVTPTSTPSVQITSFSYTGSVKTKRITDVITPGFKRLQDCGKFLPLNPVEIVTTTEVRRVEVPCNFTAQRKSGSAWFQSTWQDPGDEWWFYPWSVSVPPFDESILSYVSNAAIADAKAATWDALTSAAEAAESARLLAHTVKGFFSFARGIAHKVPRNLSKALRKQRFGQLWLEYRYGWMPMVYDAQDIIAALQRKVEDGELVRGRARVETELSDSHTTVSPVLEGDHVNTTIDVLKGTRIYRGRAFVEVTSASRARFGTDPLLTVWEKVPFSFVVDWFLDVNSFVQAASPFSGAELRGCMNSVRDSYTLNQFSRSEWGHDSNPSVRVTTGEEGASTKLTVERYTRFPSGVSLPRLNLRLTPARVLDLAALIFSGRKGVFSILRI